MERLPNGVSLDELLVYLREQCDTNDIEMNHCNADDALLAYINDARVTEAYQAIDKWYA